MSRRDFDPAEEYAILEDGAERAAASRYCPDCQRVGGHAIGCPGEEYGDDDDQQTMTAAELFELAGNGDEAALRVMANEVEFDGTVDGIYAATDEQIAEWYADEQVAA